MLDSEAYQILLLENLIIELLGVLVRSSKQVVESRSKLGGIQSRSKLGAAAPKRDSHFLTPTLAPPAS